MGGILAFFTTYKAGLYGVLAAVIFGVGLYTGIKIEDTRHLAAEALQRREAEAQAKVLADKLNGTVDALTKAKAALRTKEQIQKAKVEDEIRKDPAYNCPVPAIAIQLLNE